MVRKTTQPPASPDSRESLTVRRLDPGTKQALRLRAAQSGRSVEDEVRDILRQAAQEPVPTAASTQPGAAALATPHATATHDTKPRVTLIIGGGIAAYKSLDLIRRLRERGCHVRCVLTQAAQHFVTALSAGALADERIYTDLFDPQSEFDAGHIRLARDSELIIVAPATADLMARMASGHASDLATAILLATRAPILLAPAMNPAMWTHPATQRNVAQLKSDGAHMIGPNRGEMAESGEAGLGRMSEPIEIAAIAIDLLQSKAQILRGMHVLVTAGPTHEPIDPVRYIANRSSGKQGFAIARAAAQAGARVTLISGPVTLEDPPGVATIRVESAREMLDAVERALPADVGIFAAAVADWRVASEGAQKIKKTKGALPKIDFVENPDILATISHASRHRPTLVVGFAAETENVIANAKSKLARKGCDWIVANDVSPATGIMGGETNLVHIVTADGVDTWPSQSKADVASMLVEAIGQEMTGRRKKSRDKT